MKLRLPNERLQPPRHVLEGLPTSSLRSRGSGAVS